VLHAPGPLPLGITAAGEEQGPLVHPHGMAFGSKNRLYVADAGNQRVLVFEIPGP
jgi:hypothetical protein